VNGRAVKRVKLAPGALPHGDALVRHVQILARMVGYELEPELVTALEKRTTTLAGRRLVAAAEAEMTPSMKRRLALPKAWLRALGAQRWKEENVATQLLLIGMQYGAKTAVRVRDLIAALRRVNPKITTAVRVAWLGALVNEYATGGPRLLERNVFRRLRFALVGEAAENTAVRDARFIAFVKGEREAVGRLAKDAAELSRLGLSELDPEPLLSTSVRTAGRTGSEEARRQYVDFVVLFRGRTATGETRYLVKARGQVKLNMVHLLASEIELDGEVRVGQLVKDELRATRGPWHFARIRIDKSALIQDARHTKLLTFGSRALTDAEKASLAADKINVKHLVHDISSDEFYRWADAFLAELRVAAK
jgi:hypothetical protein